MPAQPLPQLEEPFELTKPARAIQKRLNAEIAEFNGKLAKFNEAVAAAVDSEPDAVGSLADMADNLEREKIDLLVEERRIRVLMQAYFKERNAAHGKAADSLRVTLEATEASIRERLLAMGYVDGPIPGTQQTCIIPMFFHHHPEWRLARQASLACSHADRSPSEYPNVERLAFIDREIQAVRDRLLQSARR